MLLFILRQFPVQRRNDDVGVQPALAQLSLDAPDLRHSGKKHQQAAWFQGQCLPDASYHRRFKMLVDRPVEVLRCDGKEPAFAGDRCRFWQQRGDGGAVEGGRHHEETQILAKEPL